MRNKKQMQKGITLISLVITIIILLILAVVAINLAVDSDGLFSRAQEAANKWNTSVAKEGEAIENILKLANEIEGGSGNSGEGGNEGGGEANIPVESISLSQTSISINYGDTQKLEVSITPENASNKNISWSSSNTNAVIVDNAGNITGVGGGSATITVQTEDGSKTANCEVTVNPVSYYVTEGDRTAPIPTEFVASSVEGENTISAGLVIYEGTDPVTDENHDTALTTRNQYVWIPVDNINDMIMCQTHGASVTLNQTTLQCPICGANTKLAGKLYTSTKTSTREENNLISSYIMDFTKNDQTYEPNSDYREPGVVTGSDTGDGTSYDGATDNFHGFGTAAAFLAYLQSEFDNMARSVAKYKGFYISRYEVGESGNSKKGQTILSAGEDSANKWYGLYSTLNKTGSSTKSQMIWRKPV